MAETVRRDAILKGWITLRLNFRLKNYVSRQHLWTITQKWLYFAIEMEFC